MRRLPPTFQPLSGRGAGGGRKAGLVDRLVALMCLRDVCWGKKKIFTPNMGVPVSRLGLEVGKGEVFAPCHSTQIIFPVPSAPTAGTSAPLWEGGGRGGCRGQGPGPSAPPPPPLSECTTLQRIGTSWTLVEPHAVCPRPTLSLLSDFLTLRACMHCTVQCQAKPSQAILPLDPFDPSLL